MSDNVIRFPDGDYYCPNCGGRWFRLVDPFTSVLADVPRAQLMVVCRRWLTGDPPPPAQ